MHSRPPIPTAGKPRCLAPCSWAGMVAVVVGLLAAAEVAHGQGNVPSVKATPSALMQLMTEPGMSYSVWQSPDLQEWTRATPSQLGDGGVMNFATSAPPPGQNGFYRFRLDPVVRGAALPATLSGRRYLLNDGLKVSMVNFSSDTSGQLLAVKGDALVPSMPFTYKWVATGADSGLCRATSRVPVAGLPTQLDFDFKFASGGGGSWACAHLHEGRRTVTSSGSFAAWSGPVLLNQFSLPLTVPTQVPPAGSLLVLESTNGLESLALSDVRSWLVDEESGIGQRPFQATVVLGGVIERRFSLSFTGPNCGRNTCTHLLEGRQVAETSGKFSILPPP